MPRELFVVRDNSLKTFKAGKDYPTKRQKNTRQSTMAANYSAVALARRTALTSPPMQDQAEQKGGSL